MTAAGSASAAGAPGGKDAGERRAVEVEVDRLALERRLREDAPRHPALAAQARRSAAARDLGRRHVPGLAPQHVPPDRDPRHVLLLGQSSKVRTPADEDRQREDVDHGTRSVAGAVDDVPPSTAAPRPPRPAARRRAASGPARCRCRRRGERDAAGVDAHARTPGREQVGHVGARPPRRSARSTRAGSGWRVGEERLDERVVARVHVADDREVVAALDGRRRRGRDLHVDGLKDGRRPRRAVVGERGGGPRRRAWPGRGRRAAPAIRRWSSATSASISGGRLHQRGPAPAEHRAERPVPAVGQRRAR